MKVLRQYDPRDGGAPHIMLHQEHITAVRNPSEHRTARCLTRRRRFVGNWKSFNKGSSHRLSFEPDCRETLQIASSMTKREIVIPRPLIPAHLSSPILRHNLGSRLSPIGPSRHRGELRRLFDTHRSGFHPSRKGWLADSLGSHGRGYGSTVAVLSRTSV